MVQNSLPAQLTREPGNPRPRTGLAIVELELPVAFLKGFGFRVMISINSRHGTSY